MIQTIIGLSIALIGIGFLRYWIGTFGVVTS